MAKRGPLSLKQSEGVSVTFNEAGGWAGPGSHQEQSEVHAKPWKASGEF